MAKTKSTGDPTICPQCGDPMKAARLLDEKQHAKIYDRENPAAVPHGSDTASPDVREELGNLWHCRECGYQTRIKAEDAPAATVGN